MKSKRNYLFLIVILWGFILFNPIYCQKSHEPTGTDAIYTLQGRVKLKYWADNAKYESAVLPYNQYMYVINAGGSKISDDYTTWGGKWTMVEYLAYQRIMYVLPLQDDNISVYDQVNWWLDDPEEVTRVGFPTNNWVTWDVEPSLKTNIYIHLQKIHDYFESNFGNSIETVAIITDRETINAQAEHGNEILFGMKNNVEWGKYSDVIYHEYTHNIIYSFYNSDVRNNEFMYAMSEGMADYFACSYANHSTYADGTPSERELNNNLAWQNGATVYRNGQVLSGAMWDIREEVGKSVADKLAYKAMELSPIPGSKSKFVNNLKKADQIYYGASHQNVIVGAFDGRGIEVPVPSKPSISVSSPYGQSPVVSWGNSSGATHYRLKKEYLFNGQSQWSSPSYVDNVTSPYTDNNFGSSEFGVDKARYSVEALDSYDYTSGFSNSVSVNGNTLWKNGTGCEYDINEYELYSNYPNPFNPTTTISYSIPENAEASIIVYNSNGEVVKEIVNKYHQVGRHNITLDMSEFSSGIYYYTLRSNQFVETKKMIYLK